ncbi:MAG TPA: ABC transporter substrate-binding protein [Chloroflexota bacterium]|nr:ABC transporter substrate-binding protein [Chloroflexota bacterium]
MRMGMEMRTAVLARGAVVGALLVVALACGPAARPAPRVEEPAPAAPPPRHITLANPAQGLAAPFFVAQDVGMFARHGLDVEVSLLTGAKAVDALISQQAEYALLSSRVVVDLDLAGSDLVMLAAVTPTLAYAIYGAADVGAVADLRGKAIGVSYPGAGGEFAVRQSLRRYGLEADRDYTLVRTGGMAKSLNALQQGKLHAAVLSSPTTVLARKAGLREVLDIAGLGIDYVIGALTCNRAFLQAEPDTTRRFLKGLLEGIHYAKTNPTATKQIMARYVEPADEDALEEGYTTYVERLLPRLPLVSLQSVELVLDELSAPLPRPVGPERFVENGPLLELEASGFVRHVWGE